jgi:hypothetical protein
MLAVSFPHMHKYTTRTHKYANLFLLTEPKMMSTASKHDDAPELPPRIDSRKRRHTASENHQRICLSAGNEKGKTIIDPARKQ